MSGAELLPLLGRTALAVTVALLLIAMLRRPTRHVFGAAVAYAAWVLVPAAMVAAVCGGTPAADAVLPVLSDVLPQMPSLADPRETTTSGPSTASWLIGVWLLGLLCVVTLRVSAHRRWRRRIGALREDKGGIAWAAPNLELPALVGWPSPCVVLPADFEQRFSPAERALILAHERRHQARGDLHVLLCAEAIRALLWFHPMLPWAMRALRHDQELACDATSAPERTPGRHAQPDLDAAYRRCSRLRAVSADRGARCAGRGALRARRPQLEIDLGIHRACGEPL